VAFFFAGYVADRKRLWEAECLGDCRAWWLAQLASHNLVVSTEYLPAFSQECETVLEHLQRLSTESGCDPMDIRQALRNMLRSAGEALAYNGWIEVHSRFPPHKDIPQFDLRDL
jgi:hypothetical protein